MRPVGVTRRPSSSQGCPAFGKLEPGDVITAVDGTPTPTIADLRAPHEQASARRRRHVHGASWRADARREDEDHRHRRGQGPGRSSASALSRHSTSACRSSRAHQRRRCRRAVRRPRVRPRHPPGARPGRRVTATRSQRPENSSQTARRPGRRRQAEDDRCTRSACGRVSSCLLGRTHGKPASTPTAFGSSLWTLFHRRCAPWRHSAPTG